MILSTDRGRRSVLLLAFVAAASACAEAPVVQGPAPRSLDAAVEAAAASITAEDIHERVAFLASDELLGRATPSPGLDSAAAYLVREYQRLGLRPGGEDEMGGEVS